MDRLLRCFMELSIDQIIIHQDLGHFGAIETYKQVNLSYAFK